MIREDKGPSDDLNAPLGQDTGKKRRRLPVSVPQLLAGLLAVSGLAVAGWVIFGNDPLGGEPVAVVATTPSVDKTKAAAAGDGQHHAHYDGPVVTTPEKQADNAAAAVAKAVPPPPGSKTITIIDGTSGKRQEVVLPPDGGSMTPATSKAPKAPVEQRLLDTSKYGPIPRVSPDGARPSALYAHPRHLPPGKAGAPRIAIVVGGLGISASGTADAFAKLPSPVTFAIAPYGNDLDQLAARARAGDHEVLLQAPMEPFDYPNNDPGPQTLLTSLSSDQNINRLHWLMSRFTGYVGIESYMGARFTASEPALAPILHEIAKRGLIYVDDGASSRSLAGEIAGTSNMSFARTDIVIDATPTPAEIDRALARLELLARERGTAIGFATALPSTIEHIAAWSKAVERRGLVLVPISMVAVKAKSS
jgi:uncharacterized protein